MVKARASSGSLRCAALRALAALSLAMVLLGPVPLAWGQGSSAPGTGAVSIRTADFDASVNWYQERLGFRLIAVESAMPERTALLERDGAFIQITEVDHPAVAMGDPGASDEPKVTASTVLSLLVPDVDEEVERLRKAGVDILEVPQDDLAGAYRTAQIRDNGRHRIELREPIDEAGAFNPTGR